MHESGDITFFGKTNGRFPHKTFGIKQKARFFHTYVIGKTGTGKSTLLETMALQDITKGRGLCLIDPHGDLAERLAGQMPVNRIADLIYLNASSYIQPYADPNCHANGILFHPLVALHAYFSLRNLATLNY